MDGCLIVFVPLLIVGPFLALSICLFWESQNLIWLVLTFLAVLFLVAAFLLVYADSLKSGDKELDAKFIKEADAAGFVNLKGHRSVGGMRASIYNAMPKEGVEKLVEFMKKFDHQGGLAFLLVHFTDEDSYYLLPLEVLCHYFEHADILKTHSIPRDAFAERYRIQPPEGGLFNYLRTALDYYEDKKEK